MAYTFQKYYGHDKQWQTEELLQIKVNQTWQLNAECDPGWYYGKIFSSAIKCFIGKTANIWICPTD